MPEGYYFNGRHITTQRKKNNFPFGRIFFGVFTLSSLFLVSLAVVNNTKAINLVSPIGDDNPMIKNIKDTPVLGQLITNSFNFNDQQLSKIVMNKLDNQPGDYAVVIEGLNPNSKLRFYYNEHKVMESASLYKLFLIAAAYRAIEKGSLTEETSISVPEAHLIDVLGSKEFGYDDPEGSNITYSVREILSRIATVSDNYAAIMLAEKLGWDKVQAEADAIDTQETSIKNPISSSASDIALFYQDLYQGKIVSADSSAKIVDLLSTAQLNNRIPDQLPDGLKIAHKTGELDGVRHDAGIVYLEGNPYLIVLMSENLEGEDSGIELESDISKDVYDYFASTK